MILAYVTAGPLLTTLSETGERSPDFAAGGAQTKLYLRSIYLSAVCRSLDSASHALSRWLCSAPTSQL